MVSNFKEFCFLQEYVDMRAEMNSIRYEISFWLKISLQCSVSSLLVFIWIEKKWWNSNRYRFHIGHFDQNEISSRYDIFMWTELTQSKMNKRSLVGYWGFNAHVRLKLIADMEFISFILTEMKFHYGWQNIT